MTDPDAVLASVPEGFTLGPWVAEHLDDNWQDDWLGPCVLRGDELIADLRRREDSAPEDSADAALIALAPTLVDALRAALEQRDTERQLCDEAHHERDAARERERDALGALRVAVGERDDARRGWNTALDVGADAACGHAGAMRDVVAERDRALVALADVGAALETAGVEVSAIMQDYPEHVAALARERDEAQIEAADIVEILGEMAWGVNLPTLFVRGPITLPDGTLGMSPIPTALPSEAAQMLVEAVYQRLKGGRGWLREARRERAEATHRAEAAERALATIIADLREEADRQEASYVTVAAHSALREAAAEYASGPAGDALARIERAAEERGRRAGVEAAVAITRDIKATLPREPK